MDSLQHAARQLLLMNQQPLGGSGCPRSLFIQGGNLAIARLGGVREDGSQSRLRNYIVGGNPHNMHIVGVPPHNIIPQTALRAVFPHPAQPRYREVAPLNK